MNFEPAAGFSRGGIIQEENMDSRPRTFVKNDAGFVCHHCGREVGPLSYSSRDHCPYCLHSLHVDIYPGDRSNECRGDLKPIGVELSGKKGMVILYRCQKCGQLHKNVSARDDDYDKLVRLSAHEEIE